MNMIFWITIIICVTAVTITSIICSSKIEVTKYEAFTHAVNNEANADKLKKIMEKLIAATSKTKENY